MLLRPLPFPNGERLVTVSSSRGRGGVEVTSVPDLVDWRRRQRALEALGGVTGAGMTLTTPGGAERVGGARITDGVFAALGATAERGRLFTPADDRPGAPRVAVVSRGFAERHFGDPARALGATLVLNGTLHAVVGVLPERWRFPEWSEVWVPLAADPTRESRGNRYLTVVAALRPGGSLDQARRDLAAVGAQLAREHPGDNAAFTVRVDPLRERYVGAARPAFLLVTAAAVLLFLVACANVASLQLARAAARAREVAVRSALGASGWRLVRQLLTESVLLALAGGALGTTLAVWGSELVARSVSDELPPWMTFGVSWRVLAFTVAASAAAGILFGILPALRLAGGARHDAAAALSGSPRAGSATTAPTRAPVSSPAWPSGSAPSPAWRRSGRPPTSRWPTAARSSASASRARPRRGACRWPPAA
jgi:putative ABC transport system permease protein